MGAVSGMGTAWTLILAPATSCIEQRVAKEGHEQPPVQGLVPSVSRLGLPISALGEGVVGSEGAGLGVLSGLQTC